jgi:hypothetical protein
MANWNFDPSQYKEYDFQMIPAGDHRVRITDVVEKHFKSGNEGYEMTLEVSGYNSKLWYYLVLDKSNPSQTNQRIGDFFNSFGITSPAMGSGKQWVGAAGAVRVKHEEYNGQTSAKVAFCIARKNQDKLPPWKGGNSAAAPSPAPAPAFAPEDLPFDM